MLGSPAPSLQVKKRGSWGSKAQRGAYRQEKAGLGALEAPPGPESGSLAASCHLLAQR